MQIGLRITGQTKTNDWSLRSTKNLLEYTAGDIQNKGNNWMTDKSPNSDVLTRKNDTFDRELKHSGMILCLAVPDTPMRLMPYKVGDYIETYRIYWYMTESKGNEDYWRVVVFHHATIKKISFRNLSNLIPNGGVTSYYEVLMKIGADVEYFDQYGSPK